MFQNRSSCLSHLWWRMEQNKFASSSSGYLMTMEIKPPKPEDRSEMNV